MPFAKDIAALRFAIVFAAAMATATAAAPAHAAAQASDAAILAQAKQFFGPLPDKMPGAENDTPEKITLGSRLYNETLLSANGSQSCNSCHRLDSHLGGVDNERTSPGAFGKRGGRNSPTVLNAGFQFAQFWDGRAPSLEHQAKGPILNPIEMATASDADAIQRLRAAQDYPELFRKAFPSDPDPLTYDNLANAIAAFERTLITRDRFDDFQKGAASALTARELAGLKTFVEVGCATCHSGPAIGGNNFQKAGLVHPFETPDKGRAEVTKDQNDNYAFKVPILRNIALTAPYFHDGKVATLEDAVEKMAWHQLDKRLNKEETANIVAFLKTLTDKPRLPAKRPASK